MKRGYTCRSDATLVRCAYIGTDFNTGRGMTFIFLIYLYTMQTSSTIDGTCLIMKIKDHSSNWHGYIFYRKSLINHRKIKDWTT